MASFRPLKVLTSASTSSPSIALPLFLKNTKAKTLTFDNIEIAINKLENKEVEAVVFDKPQLLYFLKENKKDNLYISKANYFKQGYGFALSENLHIEKEINHSLLKLKESQEIDKIIHSYIERDE